MKCSHNILHSNANGYVGQCSECAGIQLAFGTCIINISEEEFKGFLAQISEVVVTNPTLDCQKRKQFTYSTDSSKVRLIFSFADLEKLYHLLTPAYLMLSIDLLMDK